MHRAIESFTEEAKNEQVTVKFSAPSKPLTVMATENGLDTVMRNLICNAIKYSKPGVLLKFWSKKNQRVSKSMYRIPASVSLKKISPHLG